MFEKRTDDIISELMAKEDRKDAEFRLALVMSEIGGLAKYITHDPKSNPGARPYGSPADEVLAYGQAEVMLRGLMHIRGIAYDDALTAGLKNWQDADWRKRSPLDHNYIRGLMVNPMCCSGPAYVVDKEHTLEGVLKMKEKQVLVMRDTEPDLIISVHNMCGLVTDQGGRDCHGGRVLADLAKDNLYHIPGVVGTGNATQKIRHGDYVTLAPMDGDSTRGEVTIRG
jgi:phosphohistidine swiveling domain-containing protein